MAAAFRAFAAPLSFLARLVGAFEEEEDLTIHGGDLVHTLGGPTDVGEQVLQV